MANHPYGRPAAALFTPNNGLPDDLGTRIINTFQYTQFPPGENQRKFTPESTLAGLITPPSVIRELSFQAGYQAAQDPVIIFILNHGKKLFASSVMAQLKGHRLYYAMHTFMQNNITDKTLPLTNPNRRVEGSQDTRQPGWGQWSLMELHSFMEHQWSFLAPSFKNHIPDHHLILGSQHIFPFTEATEIAEGGFGKVYKVTIHPSHMAAWFESNVVRLNFLHDLAPRLPISRCIYLLDLSSLNTNHQALIFLTSKFFLTHMSSFFAEVTDTPFVSLYQVAIKEMKGQIWDNDRNSERYKSWYREATALTRLSGSHRHIIQVNAIISRAGARYFMFPWAGGGNLLDFYERNGNPHRTAAFVSASMEQLERLAEALQMIHTFQHQGKTVFFRHGDLKPENILVFEPGRHVGVGVWKMADLGLAKMHLDDTQQRERMAVGPSSAIGRSTIFYRPPEVAISPDSQISRLYDTWCMGCIALQFIIWLLYGYRELLVFMNGLYDHTSQSGMFWDGRGGVPPQIHWKAIEYMDKAQKDLENSMTLRSPAVAALLRVVRNRLLVCQIVGDPTSRRISAIELSNELRRIRSQGPEIGPYWWPSQHHPVPPGTKYQPNSYVGGHVVS